MLKNRMKEVVFLLSALPAIAGVPAMAQYVTMSATVATASAAADPTPRPTSWGVPQGRTFFPHDWLRGYVDFSFAPSHNEPDLGRCQMPASNFGGANSTCNAYARYLWSGYLEVQPFGKTFARHAFLFFTPTFSFGNNVPQFKYTASMAPIAYERAVGIGIELPKNFEFRLTQHQVDWLGKYNNTVGWPIGLDLGTNGPYGLYTTIGARWYFGGYGRSREGR